MSLKQQSPSSGGSAENEWGSAVPASEPRLEPLKVDITVGSMTATGDSQSIVQIHNRLSLSNDLRTISQYILTALFVITAGVILSFAKDNNVAVIIGIVLILLACGIFGLTFEGFGMKIRPADSDSTSATRKWLKRALWVLLGVMIGAGAVYIWCILKH
jgi:hypothetical protein